MTQPVDPKEAARVAAYWNSGGQSTAAPAVTEPQVASYWGQGAQVQAPAAPPPLDPDSPEAWAAAAAAIDAKTGATGAPGVRVPGPGQTFGDMQSPEARGVPTAQNTAGGYWEGGVFHEGAPPPPGPKPAAPAPVMGPTAGDDAEFEAFKAKQAAMKTPAAGGPAKGGVSNPDPYGIGAAQKVQLGAMDARMGAMDRASAAEAYRDVQKAEHQANLSRLQEEDAAIARSEQEYAHKLFTEQMTELGRQLDDVKAKKVDPYKDFKDSPALGVVSVIGSMIGGLYQGLTNGQQNQFVADLEHHIDRGVAEQERQIRDEKWTIGEGINMLHQQRQAQKDDALAALQMRNLAYEAAKNEIEAAALRDGTPIGRENANVAIEMVHGQQGQLQEQIARQKQAQAAAAAAAQHAARKEVIAATLQQYEKNLAHMTPGQAMDWAHHVVGNAYAPGRGPARPADVDGGQMTREQRGKVAMERGEAQHVSDAFNSQVDAMKRHPALNNLGVFTGAAAHLGQRAAPESAKTEQDLNELNTAIVNAIGKVAKDAEGKPNVLMMERYEKRFTIEPSDTKEMALQKIEGARNVVNRLAQQQGAAVPQSTTDVRAQLGAKPVGR